MSASNGCDDEKQAVFPSSGTPDEKLRFLIGYAALAPSNHNTQPWFFEIHGDTVDLHADKSRALPLIHPGFRELFISCGVALLQLRIALRRHGFSSDYVLYPDPERPFLVARIRLVEGDEPGEEEMRLFKAIETRHTDRGAYADYPVHGGMLRLLDRMAEEEDAIFQVVDTEERVRAIASLVANGDRFRWSDEQFHRELAEWFRMNWGTRRNSMSGFSHGLGELASYFGSFVIRHVDLHNGHGWSDRDLDHGGTSIVVISTHVDSRQSWIAAGQALGRVLLQAQSEGLSASFLNEPIQIPSLRRKLQQVLEMTDQPQIMLRVGHGAQDSPTERRPLREVIR